MLFIFVIDHDILKINEKECHRENKISVNCEELIEVALHEKLQKYKPLAL